MNKKNLKRFKSSASKHVYVTNDQHLTVWVFQNTQSPTKAIFAENDSKKMVVSFFVNLTRGVVVLEDCKPMNTNWLLYILCLPEIISELRKQNVQCPIIHHHNITSLHSIFA